MRKFGRLRGGSKPRRLVLGVHPIPTMVTLGNLLCGFGSIVLAMHADHPPPNLTTDGCIYWSAILIFGAMLFDVMDGKVARWTKSSSKFGMEMDSLCDVVSFGLAPAVLIKAMIDLEVLTELQYPLRDRYIYPLLAIYVCCAALRLARYNVEAETGHRDFFFGMPSPGAAGCVASLAVLIVPENHYFVTGQISDLELFARSLHRPILVAMPFVMVLLGVLMVTRVHYPHIGDRLLRGKKSFMHLVVLGLAFVLTIMYHEIVLALAFNGYMVFGMLNELRYQFFPSQRPPEWDVETPKLAPEAKPDQPRAGPDVPSGDAPKEPTAV